MLTKLLISKKVFLLNYRLLKTSVMNYDAFSVTYLFRLLINIANTTNNVNHLAKSNGKSIIKHNICNGTDVLKYFDLKQKLEK